MNWLLLGAALSLLILCAWLFRKVNRLDKNYQMLKSKYRPVLSLKDEISRREQELAELEAQIKRAKTEISA